MFTSGKDLLLELINRKIQELEKKGLGVAAIIVIVALLLPTLAGAYDFDDVQYIRAYDGDTITFTIPNTHPLFGKHIPVRVLGIDTPEIRGKCVLEKQLALDAPRLVRNVLKNAQRIDLKDATRGKYFRIVARVDVDGIDLSEHLIVKDLAVPNDGGTKVKDWCDQEGHND